MSSVSDSTATEAAQTTMKDSFQNLMKSCSGNRSDEKSNNQQFGPEAAYYSSIESQAEGQ